MSLGKLLQERGLESIGRFYSKYPGIVVSNIDENNTNRLLVRVPDVQIEDWAYPVGQQGNTDSGFKLQTPKVGSVVWVEFQNGDPMHPLWSYFGWAKGETPEELKNTNNLGIVTYRGHRIILKDDEGVLDISMVDLNDHNKVVFQLLIQGDTLTVKGNKVVLLEDNNGVPLSDKVTERLNNIEKDINNLKNIFTQAVSQVKPTDGGASVITYISSQYAKKLDETSISDIENPKVKQ